MGDGGTSVSRVGGARDTWVLNNQSSSVLAPDAASLRWGDCAFVRAAQFPQTLQTKEGRHVGRDDNKMRKHEKLGSPTANSQLSWLPIVSSYTIQ
jgi:hypothetical protein